MAHFWTGWMLYGRERAKSAQTLPGALGSLFLHGIFVLVFIFLLARRTLPIPESRPPLVPIDVVELGERTTAPPAPRQAAVPQQKARHGPAAAPKPHAVAPHRMREPTDALEIRLRNLARLRQPQSNLAIENDGDSNTTTTTDGASGPTAYSVRDYIRAQILRRWNLNIAELKGRNIVIPLHVVVSGKGAIVAVDILDRQRYTTDPVYRDIALSARNAVLLSAPFQLPNGTPRDGLDFRLTLNPRDTLR